MKKVVLASVLALATGTIGALPAAFAQASSQDQITLPPAELNAYNDAIGRSTPADRATAIEAFLQQYPQSKVKSSMQNQLLTAYQQAGDQANMLKTAKSILSSDPNNLRAALVDVYLTKAQATKPGTDPATAQSLLDDAAKVAQTALDTTSPSAASGLSAEDFGKLKTASTPIFLSAIATDDVGKKDYKDAIDDYQKELQSYPDLAAPANAPGINETYMLGQAYVGDKDANDIPKGIFYLTRAAQYAPAAYQADVEKAAEYWYKKYHGGMDGFDAVKAAAKSSATPPATFAITPAPPPPSPETLAHQALFPPSGPPTDIKTMALSDKEFVLTNGTQADADTVWATMKGVVTEVPGIVVQATADSVQLAVSPDSQQATPKTADFTVNMAKPLTDVPAVGSSVKYDATFDSFTKTPPMIIMSGGSVPAPPKAKAPVHHTKPAAH